jgi:hypothetical protein
MHLNYYHNKMWINPYPDKQKFQFFSFLQKIEMLFLYQALTTQTNPNELKRIRTENVYFIEQPNQEHKQIL